MEVTLSGISIVVKLIQLENTEEVMEVTLSGIFIDAKLEQEENALSPM